MQKVATKRNTVIKKQYSKSKFRLSKQPIQRIQVGDVLKTEIVNGYGACSVSGCNCQSYMGNDDTCQNCGHNYSLHW